MTASDQDFVADFTVRPGIWDGVTRIAKIGRSRHTVIFPAEDGYEPGEPTRVTFCNNCAESFIQNGHCSRCGMPQKAD